MIEREWLGIWRPKEEASLRITKNCGAKILRFNEQSDLKYYQENEIIIRIFMEQSAVTDQRFRKIQRVKKNLYIFV